MAETKVDNPPDVVQDAPSKKASEDSGEGSASPPTTPSEGKSDNYFSRKFGNVLNRSLRKFKKSGSHDKNDPEKENGHETGDKSPGSTSPEKSPSSPKSPKTPEEKRSKFPRMFRSSKKSKSVDVVEYSAASTSNVLDGDKKEAPKEKHLLATKYGEQRQVVVGGQALKEIEVTGEKQQETFPEPRRHRRISKSRRAAEFEGDELKVQCRDLNPADYEGWLFKKSTSGPLHTVGWKQCWVVLKHGILYLYKTSFDIAAQHAYSVRNFSVAPVEEKRKHTFKLVPKNVPPEALQDAKGVVFSCDSDADVLKWCDVLNKAALGFIIQPSPLPEKEEPVRRRCLSSAVRGEKPKLNGVSKQHRARSTTFTGETTGLPSAFNRSGSTSRTRKISGSGSSSVLAVGNMFLAIDEPSSSARSSNSDLSSILYKEDMDVNYKPRNHAKQQTANGTSTEDEIRMEVKKEVERINKHSKPTKPVEGKGPTVASAKKADIIRQEILNLKEKESQKVSIEEKQETIPRNEADNVNETVQDKLPVSEGEQKDKEISNNNNNNDVPQVEPSTMEEDHKENVVDVAEDHIEGKDDGEQNDAEADVEPEKEIDSMENETDSGISVEDYLKQLQSQEADVPVEEYIARMAESEVVSKESNAPEDPEDTERQNVKIVVAEAEEVADEEAEEEIKEEAWKEVSSDKMEGLQNATQEVELQDAVKNINYDSSNGAGADNDDDQKSMSEKSEGGVEVEHEKEHVESPGGMIPAEQQRKLMDAVLSLDYPSDSGSETDDADEICHYATIERPSIPNGDIAAEGDEAPGDKDDELNVIIDAPPGFDSPDDGGHQSYSKVREHNIQYGATQGGKPVVHHILVKPEQSLGLEAEISVPQANESPCEEITIEKEEKSEAVANIEEESFVETIIEEKRLEDSEAELKLDFDLKQEDDLKTEDPQMSELATQKETQQEESNVPEDQETPQLADHQTEAHQTEAHQAADWQKTEQKEKEEEDKLMELRLELREETLQMERLQIEKQIEELDELTNEQIDSKSESSDNIAVEEPSRGDVSPVQNETSILSDMVDSSNAFSRSDGASMEHERVSITVDDAKRQELSLSANDEDSNATVDSDHQAEVTKSDGCEKELESDYITTSVSTTAIKIVKVSVKQRSREADDNNDEKAFESSV